MLPLPSSKGHKRVDEEGNVIKNKEKKNLILVAIEAFLGEFEWTRTVARSPLIFLNRNRAEFYFHLKGLLGKGREGRRQRAVVVGTAEKSVTMSHHSVCVLWSEQTRRAGHGVCGGGGMVERKNPRGSLVAAHSHKF